MPTVIRESMAWQFSIPRLLRVAELLGSLLLCLTEKKPRPAARLGSQPRVPALAGVAKARGREALGGAHLHPRFVLAEGLWWLVADGGGGHESVDARNGGRGVALIEEAGRAHADLSGSASRLEMGVVWRRRRRAECPSRAHSVARCWLSGQRWRRRTRTHRSVRRVGGGDVRGGCHNSWRSAARGRCAGSPRGCRCERHSCSSSGGEAQPSCRWGGLARDTLCGGSRCSGRWAC
mmetsp:Transcript_2809/g.6339  ORF Transcript_2809/g.6339 Transcript_2809/m.6339 type:complete len:235 (+) Transcript_2809:557-1261(+)